MGLLNGVGLLVDVHGCTADTVPGLPAQAESTVTSAMHTAQTHRHHR